MFAVFIEELHVLVSPLKTQSVHLKPTQVAASPETPEPTTAIFMEVGRGKETLTFHHDDRGFITTPPSLQTQRRRHRCEQQGRVRHRSPSTRSGYITWRATWVMNDGSLAPICRGLGAYCRKNQISAFHRRDKYVATESSYYLGSLSTRRHILSPKVTAVTKDKSNSGRRSSTS